MTQAFAETLGIHKDELQDDLFGRHDSDQSSLKSDLDRQTDPKEAPCNVAKSCCNDPSVVMAPLEHVKINRTIKRWSKCSGKGLLLYINMNGGKDFCLFRMKNARTCSGKTLTCIIGLYHDMNNAF